MEVEPHNTSRRCPECGHTAKEDWLARIGRVPLRRL
ncbi:hypothetical protein ACH41H_48740 [Streptomyces sp. NPDC020800]